MVAAQRLHFPAMTRRAGVAGAGSAPPPAMPARAASLPGPGRRFAPLSHAARIVAALPERARP